MKLSTHAHNSNLPSDEPEMVEVWSDELDEGNIDYSVDNRVIEVDLADIDDDIYVNQTVYVRPWTSIHNLIRLFEDAEEYYDKEEMKELFGSDAAEVADIDEWNIKLVDTSDNYITINDLSSRNDNNLVTIDCRIDVVTNKYSTPHKIEYECIKCGEKNPVYQDTVVDEELQPSTKCISCEKMSYEKSSEELVGKRMISISDIPDGRNQPEKIQGHVYESLIDDVVSGDRVRITGIVRHIKTGDSRRERELVVTGLKSRDSGEDIDLTEEDIERIEDIASDPDVEGKLIESIAPHLVGIDEVKKGALYAMAGRNGSSDEDEPRYEPHMLMMGNPSSGKSELIKWINKHYPVSEMATSDGTTGVGLTASVTETESDGWTVSAGKLVHASGGICGIDEMDKLSNKDLSQIHTPLQDGLVNVNKADENAILPSHTIVIGAANPKNGTFDEHISTRDQFDFPSPILSRFDLIYVMKSEDVTKEQEKEKADAIIGQFGESKNYDNQDIIPVEMMTKYFYYINQIETTVPEDSREYATNRWMEVKEEIDGETLGRDLAGVVRLAIASARIRCREDVMPTDIERAIDMMLTSRQQVEDTQELLTGESATDHNVRKDVLHVVGEVFPHLDDEATRENIIQKLQEKEDYPEGKIEHYIDKHKEEGNIYLLDGEFYT